MTKKKTTKNTTKLAACTSTLWGCWYNLAYVMHRNLALPTWIKEKKKEKQRLSQIETVSNSRTNLPYHENICWQSWLL